MFSRVYLIPKYLYISVNCLVQTLITAFIDRKIANINEQSRRETVKLLFTSGTQRSAHFIIVIYGCIHSKARIGHRRPLLPVKDAEFQNRALYISARHGKYQNLQRGLGEHWKVW